MNVFKQVPRPESPKKTRLTSDFIEIIEPDPEDCPSGSLPPEGNVKLRNYRVLNDNIRAYTPTGDVHTSPEKGKLVSRFDVISSISPPRAKILELLRPEDPGRDALEAIVRPAPRRGIIRPLDEDTKIFLQRTLQTPTPHVSAAVTPEPQTLSPESPEPVKNQSTLTVPLPDQFTSSGYTRSPSPYILSPIRCSPSPDLKKERSLADELREAEEEERNGGNIRQELLREFRKQVEVGDAVERDRLGKLALMVEEDDEREVGGLTVAARRLDALLAESRDLHEELAGIQEDIQAQSARAFRCTAAAQALQAESRALRYLDDVVALLNGDVASAVRAKSWPFAIGRREPGRNYIV